MRGREAQKGKNMTFYEYVTEITKVYKEKQ